MRVISWNLNSIRARLARLLALCRQHDPDVVCLQETKATDDDFPTMAVESAGYRTVLHGQPGYNGVAILARDPGRRSSLHAFAADGPPDSDSGGVDGPTDIRRGFPSDPTPDEARVVSARIGGLRLVNAYVINGVPIGSDSFERKRRWMRAFGDWLRGLPDDPPLLAVGDFNVAPDDRDVWDPDGLRGRIHCTDEERSWLSTLCGDRLSDLLRATGRDDDVYSWWPYRDGAFERDEGLRFDLALGDDAVVARTERVWVDRDERDPTRGEGAPSDHAPVVVDLASS